MFLLIMLIFIGFGVDNDEDLLILLLSIAIFTFESMPNIILFIYYWIKSKKEKTTPNIDNVNTQLLDIN